MTLYVNNNKVHKILRPQLNQFLQDTMQFCEDSGADQNIELTLPDYDDEEVALVYIFCGGFINTKYAKGISNIMLTLFAKYPCEVSVHLHHNLSHHILKHCIDIIKDDEMHIRAILAELDYLVTIAKSGKVVFQYAGTEKFLPYMKEIKCIATGLTYEIDPEKFYEKDGILHYDPYNYIDGRIEITSDHMLEKVINAGIHNNLYLNTDFGYSYDGRKYIHKVPPEAFATWQLGEKCTIFRDFFIWYEGNPQISGWNFNGVINIVHAFQHSGIEGIGNMHFRDAVSISYAFYGCKKLKKAPHLPNVSFANNAFTECTNLTNTMNVNAKKLNNATSMYSCCTSLQRAFNNCTFNENVEFKTTFEGCTSLIKVFNNCTFKKYCIMHDTFLDCPNIYWLFNNCQNIDFHIRCSQWNCKVLFNNCTFKKITMYNTSVKVEANVLFNNTKGTRLYRNGNLIRVMNNNAIFKFNIGAKYLAKKE